MIEIQSIRKIDEQKQVVNMVVVKDGDRYDISNNTPILSGEELQAFADAKEDAYLFLIRKREYPDCPYPSFNLEEMEEWIAGGCVIPAIMFGGDEDGVAEKVEWTNKHPIENDTFDRCKPSKESIAKLDVLITKIPEAQIIKDLLVK